MLAHFFHLGAFGVERHAVTLQIDVNALRAVRGALARRLAAMTERPSALDADAGEPGATTLEENDRCEYERQHSAHGDRILGADERIEPRVIAEQRPRGAMPGDGSGNVPGLRNRRGINDDLRRWRIRGKALDVRAINSLGLIELLSLLVELVDLTAGDGVVVERDGHARIELLGPLVFGDRRGEIVVQEMQVAEVHVRAGRVPQFERTAVMHGRLLLVSLLQLQVSEEQVKDGV